MLRIGIARNAPSTASRRNCFAHPCNPCNPWFQLQNWESWHDAGLGEFGGDGFQGVMEEVTDVTAFQPGALGDLLVGKVFLELEAHDFAAAWVEGFEAQAHQADAFPAGDL